MKPTYSDILTLTELYSGKRLCLKCNKLHSMESFRPNTKEHICIKHYRERRLRIALGTPEKRAFNSITNRARTDMRAFGQPKLFLQRKALLKMLRKDQIQNFSQVCVIPRRPDEVLTLENMVIVDASQRRYIMDGWKQTKDKNQYQRDLALVLYNVCYKFQKIKSVS